MSPRKIIFATSLLSALLVMAIAAPLVFYGYQFVDKKMQADQADLKAIVVELKTEALSEIQSVAEKAANEAVSRQGGGGPAVTAALGELKSGLSTLQQSVGDLQAEQKKLAELMTLRTEGLIAAVKPAPAPMVRPGTRKDTLNQTVYFSLGAFHGAATDKQIAAIVPKIETYSKDGTCVSNVMGFSDTLGGDKSNLELSLKRAEYVASLLRSKQLPVGEVTGWGERWLVVHTVDGVKNDKNRRVVIETLCKGGDDDTDAAPESAPEPVS